MLGRWDLSLKGNKCVVRRDSVLGLYLADLISPLSLCMTLANFPAFSYICFLINSKIRRFLRCFLTWKACESFFVRFNTTFDVGVAPNRIFFNIPSILPAVTTPRLCKCWRLLKIISESIYSLLWNFLGIFIATLLRKVGLIVLSYILKDFNRKLRVPQSDVFLSHSSQSSVSNNTKMWDNEFSWLTGLSAHHTSLLCVIRILWDALFLTPTFKVRGEKIFKYVSLSS